MAIILPSGFNITNLDPIDSRFSVTTQAARLGFSAANVYEGLIVYQQDTDALYVLTNTGSYNLASGWQQILTSSGSLNVSGSLTVTGGITGSLFGTSSYSINSLTASYVLPLIQDVFITGSISIRNSSSLSTLQAYNTSGSKTFEITNTGKFIVNRPAGDAGQTVNVYANQNGSDGMYFQNDNNGSSSGIQLLLGNDKIAASGSNNYFQLLKGSMNNYNMPDGTQMVEYGAGGIRIASFGRPSTAPSSSGPISFAIGGIGSVNEIAWVNHPSYLSDFTVKNNINILSGSLKMLNGSITGSNALFTGTITAQKLIVQTVSSSVIYSSGSNNFGSQVTDIQAFTGSLRVTGSGNHYIVGGNVGIGTSTPSFTLDVSGSGRFTNNVTITGSLNVTGGITGSLLGTSSFAINSLTASYVNPLQQAVIITGSLQISSSAGSLNNIGGTTYLGSVLAIGAASDASYYPNDRHFIRATVRTDVPYTYGFLQSYSTPGGGFQVLRLEGSHIAFSTLAGNSYFDSVGSLGLTNVVWNGATPASSSYSTLPSKLYIKGNGSGSATTALLVQNSNLSSSLAILDNGNVGIGTSTPSYPLDVWGLGGVRIKSTLNFTDNGAGYFGYGSIGLNGTEFLFMPGLGGISFAKDISGTSGLFMALSTGNIGISKTSPNARLDVSGSAIISGSLIVTQGITGSLLGTSSFAINALTASYVNPLQQAVIITGSLSQGISNITSGSYSHAEGQITTAVGDFSHAEGGYTIAAGNYSHVEGYATTAIGEASHAEGTSTTAIGSYSHAEGSGVIASGSYSHAEGYATTAIGEASHAEGRWTIANGDYQHVQGAFNRSNTNPSAFILGNGTGHLNRSNLIYASGSLVQITGSLIVTQGITGSLLGTSSFAINVLTASYINPLQQAVIITGSLNISGSTTQIGNNNLLGNTNLSGSITISGSLTAINVTASFGYVSASFLDITGKQTVRGYTQYLPTSDIVPVTTVGGYIYSTGSQGDLYFAQTNGTLNNVIRLRWLEGNMYTGLLNGGIISASSSTTYQVSSGSGIVVSLNGSISTDPYPTVNYITWGNLSASIAPLSASYDQSFIAIQASGSTGIIYTQGTPYDDGQFNVLIPIGNVIHQNRSTINATATYPSVAYGYKQRSSDFLRAFGALKLSGLTTVVSGSSTGSLQITSGTAYSEGRNYTADVNNPSYVIDSGQPISKIFRYYQSGSSWVYLTNGGAGYETIDPTQYSLNGVLTPVPGTGANREFSIQRVYYFPAGATKGIYIYYGNATYPTLADAIANIAYEDFIEAPNTSAGAVLSSYIIVRNNANFTVPESYNIRPAGLFRNVGGSGGGGSAVTQLLSGLSDVNIIGPTDGQPLVYNTIALKWENQSTLSASLSGNASTATTASYALTASYVNPLVQDVIVTGSLAFTGDITGSNALFTGTITAQKLVVQTVSSSVIYSSGSNTFGNDVSNIQSFTGSLRVTGSGNHYVVGGNVGIGTTTPNARLDITGNILGQSSTTDDTPKSFTISSGHYSNTSSSLDLITGISNASQTLMYIGGGSTNNAATDVRFFTAATNTTLTGTERMRINSIGNVGIGTITPTFTLDVSGSAGATARFRGSGQSTVSLNDGTNENYLVGVFGAIRLAPSGSIALTALGNGNVGIGTTTPSFKLDVSGSSQFYKTSSDYIQLLQDVNSITFSPNAPSYLKYGSNIIMAMKSGGGNSTILYGAGSPILSATQKGVSIRSGVDGAFATSMLQIRGSGSASTTTALLVQNSNASASLVVLDNGNVYSNGPGFIASNTAFGYQSLNNPSSSATQNTTLGYQNLSANNMSGYDNVALGYRSLQFNTTGYQNLGIGTETLQNNTTGIGNTAVGHSILRFNTIGGYNVGIGFNSLYALRVGSSNTSIGASSFSSLITGSSNIGIGNAGGALISGSSNIFIGAANNGIITGSGNVIIGANQSFPTSLDNTIAISDGVGNMRMYISSSGNVGIGTTTPISTLDVNGKVSIKNGLDFFKASTNIVGSYNADASNYQDLLIKANSYDFSIGAVNKLFISSAGNVGIGTITPTEKLHISGNIKVEQASNVNAVITLNPYSSALGTTYQWNLVGSNSARVYGFQIREAANSYLHINNSAGGSANAGNIGIGTEFNTPVYKLQITGSGVSGSFNANNILYVSGSNVGIGTTTPTSKLHVAGLDGAITQAFTIGTTTPNYWQISALAYNATKAKYDFKIGDNSFGAGDILLIPVGGNVGIGTTSPNAKLDINGNTLVTGSITATGNITTTVGNLTVSNGNVSIAGTLSQTGGYPISATLHAITSNFSSTSGTSYGKRDQVSFNPTSGTSTYIGLAINTSINQTGGANGITRGLYVSPTLTAAADYRAIETTLGKVIFNGGNVGIGTAAPSASLHVAGTTILSSSFNTAISGSTLKVQGSGSTQPIFTVVGSQGELFSITDSLSGSLFSVNDISGLPILEVFSDNTILMGDYQAPALYATDRIASTVLGSNVIYSFPTSSYDGVFMDYTVKSGSNARAGNFAAIWSGTAVNYMDNSTTDFGSTTGMVLSGSISGSNMVIFASGSTAGWTFKGIIKSI